MPNLKGTKTEENLWAAYTKECQGRSKYSYFESKARSEGYEQIAQIFHETAHNEKAHGKIWFEKLGALGNTAENLHHSMESEHYEGFDMYTSFAKTAQEEGFDSIANLFLQVGEIEKTHEQRFGVLLEEVKNNQVFQKPTATPWICRNCGHHHVGTNAPQVCPVCSHPKAFFQVLVKN